MTRKERFMAKVSVQEGDDPCWEWTAAKNKAGYGMFWMPPNSVLAHRASYMLYEGEIPEGKFVCHSCDNPSCVNPDHLWIGDAHDNHRDMLHKGRSPYQKAVGPVHIVKRQDGTHYYARKIGNELHQIWKDA